MRVERVGRWGMSLNPSAVKTYSLTYLFGVVALCPAAGLVSAFMHPSLFVVAGVVLATFLLFNIVMGIVPIVPGILRVRRRLRAIRRGRLHLRIDAPPPPRLRVAREDVEEDLPADTAPCSPLRRGRRPGDRAAP